MNAEEEAAQIIYNADTTDLARETGRMVGAGGAAVGMYRTQLLTWGVPLDEVIPLVGSFSEMYWAKHLGLGCQGHD